jgi:hypothetical protein
LRVKEQSKNIIEHLKKVKEDKGLTFQEISDMTAENNEYVSVSTIKNVFSEKNKHIPDYNKTIKPIARVLIGDIDDDQYPIASSYAAISEYKDLIIEKLNEQIATLIAQKESSSKKHKEHETLLIEQIDFYKEQIKFKDSEIKRLTANIDRKDAMLKEFLIKGKD